MHALPLKTLKHSLITLQAMRNAREVEKRSDIFLGFRGIYMFEINWKRGEIFRVRWFKKKICKILVDLEWNEIEYIHLLLRESFLSFHLKIEEEKKFQILYVLTLTNNKDSERIDQEKRLNEWNATSLDENEGKVVLVTHIFTFYLEAEASRELFSFL